MGDERDALVDEEQFLVRQGFPIADFVGAVVIGVLGLWAVVSHSLSNWSK